MVANGKSNVAITPDLLLPHLLPQSDRSHVDL